MAAMIPSHTLLSPLMLNRSGEVWPFLFSSNLGGEYEGEFC